ncbi:hypothetical protein BYT27DRAFT_7336033 [Phlegmacium glaucopus]|nr:hypothetical protein BYT27DRAFT_7336033 [Phlegmacium glaucopus]
MRFLKDPWQEDLQRMVREAVTYRMLKEDDVNHVSSMRLGGDIPGLGVGRQKWITELSSKLRRLKRKMVFHRITLDTVTQDLSTFTWCKVLLSCIADAVEGIQQASKAGILHRDLSAGNIMIVKDKETKESRGILIDWDMCPLWRKHGGEPRSGRAGTWAFMSAKILQNQGPTVRHTLWDDIESAFWVFVYEALLYLKHDEDPRLLYEQMQAIFSHNTRLQDGPVVGGREKMSILAHCLVGRSNGFLTQFEKIGVNELLDQLGKVLMERYLKNGKPSFNLDDPDETWFSERLRGAAMKMEPLCITPTGLKSPTNDSNPPDYPRTWESATISDSKMDYFLMPLDRDPTKSTGVGMYPASEITRYISSFLVKRRRCVGESEEEEGEGEEKEESVSEWCK